MDRCLSVRNLKSLSSPNLPTFYLLQGFDAMLTDPMIPTGSLIARKLGECVCMCTCLVMIVKSNVPSLWFSAFHPIGLPSVGLLRGIPCGLDLKSAACPSPPSYVPRFFTKYTDVMSFKERVVNVVVRAQPSCTHARSHAHRHAPSNL